MTIRWRYIVPLSRNDFQHTATTYFKFCLFYDLYFCFYVTCARLSWSHSAFQSTLNSLSYRTVSLKT